MSADPSDPHEVEGVLNPATAWGSDGELYLYPRLVAEGNIYAWARRASCWSTGYRTGSSDRASFWNLIAPGSTAFSTEASKTHASRGSPRSASTR